MYVSVLGGELGGALGVDGGWLPLPTHPQRYCDPASLVFSNEPTLGSAAGTPAVLQVRADL